jgi:hypothetical protein
MDRPGRVVALSGDPVLVLHLLLGILWAALGTCVVGRWPTISVIGLRPGGETKLVTLIADL